MCVSLIADGNKHGNPMDLGFLLELGGILIFTINTGIEGGRNNN